MLYILLNNFKEKKIINDIGIIFTVVLNESEILLGYNNRQMSKTKNQDF